MPANAEVSAAAPQDAAARLASAGGVPLTEAQLGLWYAQRLDPANPIFNVAHAVAIDGPLDLATFEHAVNTAAAEADSLALRMIDDPMGPRQCVDPARRPRLAHFDVSTAADPDGAARDAMRRDLHTPIDPTRDALAASLLFTLGRDRHLWYLRAHHLAIDGYGMTLLTDRAGELYSARLDGRPPAPPPPYAVVIAEDEKYRASAQRSTDAAYWQAAFAAVPAVAGMAPGPAVTARSFHRVERAVTAAVRERVRALADARRVPWPDVLTVLVALYCQRMTGAAETVVGVPHMGRFGSRAARVPAMVMNVLPVALALDESRPLAELCTDAAAVLARARRHGRYRSEQLRRDLGLLGGDRRLYGPLINVLPFDRPPVIAAATARVEVLATGPVDDITFTFRGDATTTLSLEVESNPNLYSRAASEAHAARLAQFVEAVLASGSAAEPPTATPAEARHLVYECNATEHEVADTTLTELVEASMRRTPDAPAVVFAGTSLTYAELERRSGALAAALRQRGIGADDVVAVALPRSIELIVALVAVLRAGAAYLPLDPQHPRERLERLTGIAAARCVLVEDALAERFGAAVPPLPASAWPQRHAPPAQCPARPDSAAYVIFTSGSTGEPKGVLVEHRAIVNRLEWMRVHYGFDAADRILQKTPTTFDVSVWELFLPLIVGATLVVARPGEHRDPRALAELIRAERITTAHFVPSMLAAFLAEPRTAGLALDRVFCSGEELGADLRNRFHAIVDTELHNLYGPTEAAVDVSFWPAEPDAETVVPIGYPVWNTRLYVLDDRLRPVPAGVPGHLFIGGVQLARGYVGRPDLTRERFVGDPFVPGGTMYRTGDLAYRRADDAIVFLGRSDHQIKVRGLRVEPGEIETALSSSGLVRRAAVIAREDRAGDKRIVAYVVPAAGYDVERLRGHLAARLPDYMIPAAFVALDDLPVSPNGKLDRAALPAPRFEAAAGRPAQTPTETLLARLFADVLGLDAAPGADGDFFSLGGDSLLAVQLMRRIAERLGRDPGLGTLFTQPTVARLAAAIDAEAPAVEGLEPLLALAASDATAAPLFVVHPAGGIAWCYRHLAQALGRGRAVYGLQAPALDPAVALPSSLDALAAEYVERITAIAPHGPYHLAGWSVGGIIAHAMAVHLRALGRDVGLLAVLDAYPSDCWRAEPEPDAGAALRALLAVAGYDPQQHAELATREAIVAFLRAGGSPLGRLPEVTLDGVIRVVTATNRLVRNHYHARFDGALTHVRASLDHTDGKLAPERWRAYVEALDVVDVPFVHADLTGRAATRLIAPALEARLDAIDRAARSV